MRVMRAWIDELPLRMQSTLLLALRGPDGMPKENLAKDIVREYRYVILIPAFPRELKADPTKKDDFMGTQTGYLSYDAIEAFKESHDEFPHHWLMHLMHAAEIVGQHHPDDVIRTWWWAFYVSLVDTLHLGPETIENLQVRLHDPRWIADWERHELEIPSIKRGNSK